MFKNFLKNFNILYFRKLIEFYLRWKSEAILFIGFLFGAFLDWPAVEITIFLIFLWAILKSLKSEIFIVAAFFLFTVIPVFLFLKKPERAEEFSVYAYYFLVIAVIRAIIEVRSEKNDEQIEEKP